MSSVETIRVRRAMATIRPSGKRSDHGQWANSSTPAPTARSAWPTPWTWAVTMAPAACAASHTATSSSSARTGPASLFIATLTTDAELAPSTSPTAPTASSGPSTSTPVPEGAQAARVG